MHTRIRVIYIENTICLHLPFTMRKIDLITHHSEVSEKAIERYLVDEVKELGGICLKYTNPGSVGFPDRICLLPGGITIWIELKSKGEQLRQVQKIRISKLLRLGHIVHVCDSKEAIDRVLQLYKPTSK